MDEIGLRVEELAEELQGFLTGAADGPPLRPILADRAEQVTGQEVLVHGGVGEAEGAVLALVASGKEGGHSEILLQQVWAHAVVPLERPLRVPPLVEPILYLDGCQSSALVAPEIGRQVFHEAELVLRFDVLLACVAVQPSLREPLVDVHPADGLARAALGFEFFQLLADHLQGDWARGQIGQVVHLVQQLHGAIHIGAACQSLEVAADLLAGEG